MYDERGAAGTFQRALRRVIDHLNQVISFHPADGFEHLPFATHEAQMHFALEKCKDGYKIQ